MKIAAAQIRVVIGDLEGNGKAHLKMMNLAVEHEINLLVFPEMSLTGYCREEAADLAFTQNDSRLEYLQKFASKNNITLVVGAPIQLQNKLFIGSFIIQPNVAIKIYTKQFLHKGEELFFKSSFNYNPVLNIQNEQIALAICADIDCDEHAVNASKNNVSIYIPSIFFSENGIEKGHEILTNYAKKYSFHIVMSNYCGTHWNTLAGGKSAFWNNKGEKTGELNSSKEGLLIAARKTDIWITKNIYC